MRKGSPAPIALQGVQKVPSSKAAGSLARGAYTVVHDHDKGLRTPLADFFSILLVEVGRDFSHRELAANRALKEGSVSTNPLRVSFLRR